MEVDDPDLDAFETSTRAQLRARELGKIEAAMRHLFPIFDQTLLSLSRWEYRATTMLHENFNAVHHLTSSLIWTNHRKISGLKNPQNGLFKGIFSSVPTDGAQMKLMKLKFGQWWNSNAGL